MQRILITGASGFIGRNLAKYISEKTDYEITSVTFKGDPEPFERETIHSKIDLTDQFETEQIFIWEEPFDIVFDLASISGGFRYLEENVTKVLSENMLMNLNVLNSAIKFRAKKILFASSACVYPAHKINKTFIEEDAYPIDPENMYGLQKIYMENVYREYAKKYPIEIYIPRLQGIYGPFMQYEGIKAQGLANLCYKLINIEDGESIELFGDGTQMRDYLYVDDCIEAMLKLVNTKFHEPINISYGIPIKLDDCIYDICKILNKKVEIKYTGENSNITFRNTSNKLAHKKIKWMPSTYIEEGYVKMINWIKEA